jgi:tRNA G18 (ribose-2'-O)-methylase SpoU
MNVVEVTDADDPRLADYRGLTDVALRSRLEPPAGLFLAESALVITRALGAGYPMRSALVSWRWLESLEPVLVGVEAPVFVGTPALLEQITGFNVHRGAIASMHRLPLPDPAMVLTEAAAGGGRVLICEDIVSHTNLGAIVRSAAGLGFDAVLLTPRCADPLYRRSVRVSMGAVLTSTWTRLAAWPDDASLLRKSGFSLLALTPADDAEDIRGVQLAPGEPVALLLGTEGDGLSAPTLAAVDRRVRIPMARDVDSLNVAAAAAVACWALAPMSHR